jgi:hypothetical protein
VALRISILKVDSNKSGFDFQLSYCCSNDDDDGDGDGDNDDDDNDDDNGAGVIT